MSRSEITIGIKSGEEAEYAEQQPADEGANEAHAGIPSPKLSKVCPILSSTGASRILTSDIAIDGYLGACGLIASRIGLDAEPGLASAVPGNVGARLSKCFDVKAL